MPIWARFWVSVVTGRAPGTPMPRWLKAIRIMRIRPGRTTPPFSNDGNTHILVLQGNVQIAAAGGTPQTLPYFNYAFVPPGYAITLSNPSVYAGPGISQ